MKIQSQSAPNWKRVEASWFQPMKVNVIVAAYNHEKFIGECLDNILKQQTNFEVEILIGEDGSSDRTREIVEKYGKQYSDKIKVFLNDPNNVLYIDGHRTGRLNYIHLLKQADGKYAAFCDGDDFWTDPLKLQKQVDFLESHPDFAICFHRIKIAEMDGNGKAIGSKLSKSVKEITTIKDLAKGNYIAHSSCVFRNKLFKEFPEWCYRVPIFDWPHHLLNASYGKIKYINEAMATYRIHQGNYTSSFKPIERYKRAIQTFEICKKHFYPRFRHSFNLGILKLQILIFRYYVRKLIKKGSSCLNP